MAFRCLATISRVLAGYAKEGRGGVMYDLTEEQRKKLTEYLGEKWNEDYILREWPCYDNNSLFWSVYDPEDGTPPSERIVKASKHNRPFTSWPDAGALIEEIKERGEWEKFEEFAVLKSPPLASVVEWLFDAPRLIWLVARAVEEGVLTTNHPCV